MDCWIIGVLDCCLPLLQFRKHLYCFGGCQPALIQLRRTIDEITLLKDEILEESGEEFV